MFKNVMIYRIDPNWSMNLDAMEAALAALPFHPCGPTQSESFGWVPPRGEAHGALVESIAGQRILRFQIETKSVPASMVKQHLGERTVRIEQTEGRKPGRKESRELMDEVRQSLLPHAFPKTASILVWFDLLNRRLVLDCSSQFKADMVVSTLVKCLAGLKIVLLNLNTLVAPQAAMTQWLVDRPEGWPGRFSAGRFVELNSGDETKSMVKFDHHHLDDGQMRLHIGQGKLPTQLALDWDGRVSLVLTKNLQLKKLTFLDGVFEEQAGAEERGGFDSDVAIATGELAALITDLVGALGGELA